MHRRTAETAALLPRRTHAVSDWLDIANDTVAALRATMGADLQDPALTRLVDGLSGASEEFRRLWTRHDARPPPPRRDRSGTGCARQARSIPQSHEPCILPP